MAKIRDPKLSKTGEHVFIASPFFNPRQIAVMDMVAQMVVARTKLPIYSSKDKNGILRPDSSLEERRAIVQNNRENIIKSFCMVAILDYPLAEGIELRLVKPTNFRAGTSVLGGTEPPMLGEMRSPHLSLTDNGVAWEIGFAVAAAIPVIGYVHDARLCRQINVMLSDTAEGVLVGEKELAAFLGSFKGIDAPEVFPWKELQPWRRNTQ